MKKVFTFFIILVTGLSASAFDYPVATADNGGSNKNNGSKASPWLTLSYACANVPPGPHTIYIGEGTFYETSQVVLAAGVSITGSGPNTVIQLGFREFLDPYCR